MFLKAGFLLLSSVGWSCCVWYRVLRCVGAKEFLGLALGGGEV